MSAQVVGGVLLLVAYDLRRFFNTKHEKCDRDSGRQRRPPKDSTHVTGQQEHQNNRSERTDKCANSVQRLSQSVCSTSNLRRRNIGDKCIAWSATDTFADAIDETGTENFKWSNCERKHRFGDCPESVANHREQLSLSEPVTKPSGEYFCDRSGCFSNAFNDAEQSCACTERGDEKDRQ